MRSPLPLPILAQSGSKRAGSQSWEREQRQPRSWPICAEAPRAAGQSRPCRIRPLPSITSTAVARGRTVTRVHPARALPWLFLGFLANMMGCKSNSLTCLQGGKPGLPLATATDSTATLNKLALATGGTEKSWYRCIFPFGIVSVVIGVAATCITFTINGPQMDIAKVVSVATLIFGVGLLVAAYVCWRAKRERQRKRQRQEPVSLEQGAL